jgi:hypothetical protein
LVRALARVGLVWAVAVLGALFMTMSAAGQPDDASTRTAATAGAQSPSFSMPSVETPRTAGLVLALVLLGGGVTVLAIGASRGDRGVHGDRGDRERDLKYAADPDPGSDLPLALGLSLLA